MGLGRLGRHLAWDLSPVRAHSLWAGLCPEKLAKQRVKQELQTIKTNFQILKFNLVWGLVGELKKTKGLKILLELDAHLRFEKNAFLICFRRVGPKIWNSLPSDMRNLPKSIFQKKLFEILSKSDDYLEITEIMRQLKFN